MTQPVGSAVRWVNGKIFTNRPTTVLALRMPSGIQLQSCTVTTLPWLQKITKPVISRGPKGSFYEKQIIPGAIIEYDGLYYMYVMAGMAGDEEGSSRRTIGVAMSPDSKAVGGDMLNPLSPISIHRMIISMLAALSLPMTDVLRSCSLRRSFQSGKGSC